MIDHQKLFYIRYLENQDTQEEMRTVILDNEI